MKILVPLHGFINWNGGLDLIRLLIAVLQGNIEENKPQIVFAIPQQRITDRIIRYLLGFWQRHLAKVSSKKTKDTELSSLALEVIGNNECHICGSTGHDIAKLAHEIGADIVFPTMVPINDPTLTKIGYIFDFQHRHLPNLFSQRMIGNRNKQFAALAANSDALIVNSDFVRDDVIEYLGFDPVFIFKLPFLPFKNATVPIDISRAIQKYKINAPYLIVCNHFWMHKDHKTVLRAFAILTTNKIYANLELVLTGDPVDHRNPSHYADLIALTDQLNIRERVHFLGLIPKTDQLSLLCGASALIQPTLFEGGPGGGSVYEAIGYEVNVVLSDIKINREINNPNIYYFEPSNPESLVTGILIAISNPFTALGNQSKIEQFDLIASASKALSEFMNKLLIPK